MDPFDGRAPMASELGHAHAPHAEAAKLPRLAWGVLAVVGIVVAAAWLVTWRTADDYNALVMAQVEGSAPTQTALYLALSGVMMVAMMLPSALPMLAGYAGLARVEAGPAEARLRSLVFGAGYLVVWAAFTALALVALLAFGLMGDLGGPMRYAPGVLLVAAGVYQLTGWKQFCLRHCRTPVGFVMAHWRPGRAGAARMGLQHAAYCLGCCWLLMLVLFVAGAMSVLWMGVFAALILGEKVWSRGARFSQAMGVLGIAVGAYALWAAWHAPVVGGTVGAMGM
jgi:predicted metal-binding membrane protein